MKFLPFLFPLGFFLVFGGSFLFRRIKHGSWTGAMLGGSIDRTVGEIDLAGSIATSQVLRVHTMRKASGEEPFVAVVLTSRAPLAASMMPIKFSMAQARELARLLEQAVAGS